MKRFLRVLNQQSSRRKGEKGHSILVVLLASFTMAFGFTTEVRATKCKRIRAQIVSSLTTTGCTSPIGHCTEGEIEGNRGLNGTTSFIGESAAAGPSTAPEGTISYSGVREITTDKGTLTTLNAGVFNTSTGPAPGGFFASFAVVTGGTGKFQGATGDLFETGKLIAGQFVAAVRGELCLP